jgi:formylglycine-generating enzyme required for sulfatase activity
MKKYRCFNIVAIVVILFSVNFAFAACPSMDATGDCFVGLEDFAVVAVQWLTGDPNIPDDMVYIPAGGFAMGDHFDPEGDDDELPVHAVLLDSFFMGKYEITNQQYCDYLNDANSLGQIKVDGGVVYAASDSGNSFPYCSTSSAPTGPPDYGEYSQIDYSAGVFSVNIKDGTTDMSEHPMVTVSWYGAAAYCNWRSSAEGYESCYNLSTWEYDFSKHGYRLPTEAEWEYAARGGQHSPYYNDSIDGSKANYWASGDPYETGDYPWTTPVGYYDGSQIPAGSDMANGYGLYDVAGNVWEWCNDWYGENYYDVSPYDNPEGPASSIYRVMRGGSWNYGASSCRVADRFYYNPGYRGSGEGFRIVLDLE